MAHCGFSWDDVREVLLDAARASFPVSGRDALVARQGHLLDAALASFGLRAPPPTAPASAAVVPSVARVPSPRAGGGGNIFSPALDSVALVPASPKASRSSIQSEEPLYARPLTPLAQQRKQRNSAAAAAAAASPMQEAQLLPVASDGVSDVATIAAAAAESMKQALVDLSSSGSSLMCGSARSSAAARFAAATVAAAEQLSVQNRGLGDKTKDPEELGGDTGTPRRPAVMALSVATDAPGNGDSARDHHLNPVSGERRPQLMADIAVRTAANRAGLAGGDEGVDADGLVTLRQLSPPRPSGPRRQPGGAMPRAEEVRVQPPWKYHPPPKL